MVEFTKDELLEIANWAMAKADSVVKMRANIFYFKKYEMAQAIFDKAHNEYCKLEYMLQKEG